MSKKIISKINESFGNTKTVHKKVESLIDKLIEQDQDRTDFPEPDRNEVADIPLDNIENTLDDIVDEVSESYISFAKSLMREDLDSAAKKMVNNVVKRSNTPLSPGEQERLKEKFKRNMIKMQNGKL